MGIGIGDLVKNVVTLGAYGQREAQKKAQDAQRRAEMEARRIAAEQKPLEEAATMGLNEEATGAGVGQLDLAVEPTKKKKKPSGLGTSASTGLSSLSDSGLGFGG